MGCIGGLIENVGSALQLGKGKKMRGDKMRWDGMGQNRLQWTGYNTMRCNAMQWEEKRGYDMHKP